MSDSKAMDIASSGPSGTSEGDAAKPIDTQPAINLREVCLTLLERYLLSMFTLIRFYYRFNIMTYFMFTHRFQMQRKRWNMPKKN